MSASKDPSKTDSLQLNDFFFQQARAYISRGEARLSTMHRVAGVFVSGAGLLTIIPFMLKDAMNEITDHIPNNYNIISITLYGLLLTTVIIAIFALGSLFKNLILFYFSSNHESAASGSFLPRFSLSALAFPTDEDPNTKSDIIKNIKTEIDNIQRKEIFDFLLPKNKPKKYNNYEKIAEETQNAIIPKTRNTYQPTGDINTDKHVLACLVAMGMAGLYDRTLIEEVARMEVSLTRHANSLRKLVLRYFKSMILIGTRILFIFIIGVIIKKSDDTSIPLILFQGFFVIALITTLVLRLPLLWIHLELAQTSQTFRKSLWDKDISRFEHIVFGFVICEIIMSIIGFLSIYYKFQFLESLFIAIVVAILFVIIVGYSLVPQQTINYWATLYKKGNEAAS